MKKHLKKEADIHKNIIDFEMLLNFLLKKTAKLILFELKFEVKTIKHFVRSALEQGDNLNFDWTAIYKQKQFYSTDQLTQIEFINILYNMINYDTYMDTEYNS